MPRKYTIPTAFTEERIIGTYEGDLTLLNQVFGAALAMEQGQSRKPLTQWTGDYFGNARMPTSSTDPDNPGAMQIWGVTNENPVSNIAAGDPNPFFRFIDSVDKTGNTIVRGADWSTLTTINDDDLNWMNGPGRLTLLVAAGGDVEGLVMFFVVPEANYEDDVPEGFPFSTIQDDPEDEETIRQRTWEEWTDGPSHEHLLIDGNYYIMSNAFDTNVTPSQWVPFYMAGAVDVVMSIPPQELV